jgi:hypothetical protein
VRAPGSGREGRLRVLHNPAHGHVRDGKLSCYDYDRFTQKGREMKVKCCIAVSVLSCALSAVAAEKVEPLGFKQYVLGATFEEAGDPNACKPSETQPNRTTCTFWSYATISGVVIDTLKLDFLNGRLAGMLALFPSDSFDDVSTALIQKYGKPVLNREKVRTKAGVEHQNIRMDWRRRGQELSLVRFGLRVTESYLSANTDEFGKILKRESDEAAKKRLGDT